METAKIAFSRPSTIETLRQPVEQDFQAVNRLILKELSSPVQLVQAITHHIVESGGKRLRPLVVLLTARACGYEADAEHHELATVIEFIHTATLLHDDVIDHSELRRGQKTAYAVWGGQASVLIGDFLYSRAFQIMARRSNIPVMEVLANTTNQIAEGEIWQLMNQNNSNIDEATYYKVIRRKTAQLFSAATEIGAIIGNSDQALKQSMAAFGLHLGMAYQIIDDLLDYSECPSQLDKNVGNDLTEGKMTLPLIYAKQQAPAHTASFIEKAIQQGGPHHLSAIMQIIHETRAREYAQQKAIKEAEAAQIQLQCLPLSPYRNSLEQLTNFIIQRQY